MNAALRNPSIRPRRFSIYIPLALLAGALAIAGFWPRYFGPLLAGRPQVEWFIHLHAVIFLGWIGIVIFQAYFAATGRMVLHLRLGRLGMAYGAALAVSGLALAVFLFSRNVAAGGRGSPPVPLLAALTDILAFSIFLVGAWFTRTRPDRHQRFILLATTALIVAGVSRLFGGMRTMAPGEVLPMFAVWLSPVWIAMIYDWVRHRIVHGVYVFGALVLLAVRFRPLIRESVAWNDFVRWLAQRFL